MLFLAEALSIIIIKFDPIFFFHLLIFTCLFSQLTQSHY